MSFFVSPSINYEVTQEEFILFHRIHRQLFTRLVVNLGRDPAESMRVMALWLWLERAQRCRNLVSQILPLPITLLKAMAKEAVLILSCIEHDIFPSTSVGMEIDLTLRFSLNEISLSFFHGIRTTVLLGVTELVQDVCSRAFQDILERLLLSNNGINHQNWRHGLPVNVGNLRVGYAPSVESRHHINFNTNVAAPTVGFANSSVGPRAFFRSGVPPAPEISRVFGGGYGLSNQRPIPLTELNEFLQNITLNDNEVVEEEEIVPEEDRTIFLTFSKGYPITEIEVHNFITRRYGRGSIEAIYMQDVLPDQQALYARLVVKNVSTISLVLRGQSRVKFSINGKHVWARKFVKRQTHQAQDASTSTANARHN